MEFVGIVIDSTDVFPAPSKLTAIAKVPRPQAAGDLCVFVGMTGYLKQFLTNYTISRAPLTDTLRNKELASKSARKKLILWEGDEP